MTSLNTKTVTKALVLLFISFCSAIAFAASPVNLTKHETSFEDIKLEIENAIIENGFVIDFNGNIARMLENTANVADDGTQVFSNAEFWQFCSSEITRKLTKADPLNIAYCPFVVFAFETLNEPGTVTIGYRPLPTHSSIQTNDIINEINSLLESIAVKAGQ